eukprot:symbB.v1.2.022277.t1/scaffold1968.1/size94324/10
MVAKFRASETSWSLDRAQLQEKIVNLQVAETQFLKMEKDLEKTHRALVESQEQQSALQEDVSWYTAQYAEIEFKLQEIQREAIRKDAHAAECLQHTNEKLASCSLECQKLQQDLCDFQGRESSQRAENQALWQDLKQAKTDLENSEQQRSFVEMENQNLKQQVHEYKEKELDWDSTLTSQRAENLALHQDLDEAETRVSELENDLSRGVGEREHIKNELMDCQVQKSMLEAALSHQHNKTFTAQQGLHQAEEQLHAAQGLLAKSRKECQQLQKALSDLEEKELSINDALARQQAQNVVLHKNLQQAELRVKEIDDLNFHLKTNLENVHSQKIAVEEELSKAQQVVQEKTEELQALSDTCQAEKVKLIAEQNAHADLQRHLRKEQRRGAVAQALHAALRQRLEAAHHQGDRARQELREVRGWAENLEETVFKMQQCIEQSGMDPLMDVPMSSPSSQESPAVPEAAAGSSSPAQGCTTVHVTPAAAEIMSVPTPQRAMIVPTPAGRQWSLTPANSSDFRRCPNGQKLRFETAGIGDNLLGNGRWIMADDKGLARSDNMWTKTSDIFCHKMPTPSPTAALEKLCTELQADFQLLRQELYQEQQDVIARVTAMETRFMAGPPAGRRHSVWKTGSDATEVSPSSIPSRGHRSVWKTTSDRSGSPNLSDEHLRESAESVSNANQEGKLENYTLETINVETEGNGNAGNAAMDTNEEDEMTESVEVHFEESAWSIPMVLGLVDAGRFDTAYAVLLLFVNCGMQVMFSGILLSDGFMGEDFSEEAHNAQVWRTSVAHDYKYMDLAQTSLVSRVCSGDGALILSTVQATLVRQINSYLGIPRGTKDFEAPTFQPGLLLCVLCILLWSLCVYKEFRGISMCLAGAFQIPRSHKTVFKAGEFYRISFCRFALLLFTLCTRAAVACVLLFAGILWLARTTSISELMLNAVALNAILDVDEFLFLGLTPMKFQHAIQSLSPLRVAYSRRRSEWESSVQCLMLLLTMWLPFVILLRPLSATMLEVKENLCGGNQAFVIYHNPETQLTYGLNTRDQRDLGQSADLSVSEVAVQAHKFSASDDFPEYITFSATREVFEVERTQTMTQVAESFPLCLETDGQRLAF